LTGEEWHNLPFTGIATFAKFPLSDDLSALSATAAVLGAPWDGGVAYRPGARLGPRAIREYSTRFALHERGVKEKGYFHVETGRRVLLDTTIVDCGDVDVVLLDHEKTFARIEHAVRTIVSRNALPVIIGGDHSVSYPVVRGLPAVGPFDIVQIDAHLDFTDTVHGLLHTNASALRRIAELPFVGQIVQVGVRGIRTDESALQAATERGNVIVTMADIRNRGLTALGQSFDGLRGAVYLTIDIDAMDPSIAPGTSSPTYDGFAYWQVLEIVRLLTARNKLVGLDVTEVNPLVDQAGLTASLAAQLILEILGIALG
jgi:agmatinase